MESRLGRPTKRFPLKAAGGSIDADRLWASIMHMAQFGALPDGGCNRQALTDVDRAARDQFAEWSRSAGCQVRIDPFGNIFAIRPGRQPGAPVVLLGSHLDTQPHGGLFDGIYGVMAGLEVLRALNDHKIETKASICVVNWTNEEGVRFTPGLTGSKAFAGLLSATDIAQIRSRDGLGFEDELIRIGYHGDLESAELPIRAYLEAHIEQGPILELKGDPIGVVSGIQGVRWFRVTIEGADRHAGTTSMEARRDSFMAAARMAVEMRRAALAASEAIRFTIGRVNVKPGSTNTVPGETIFEIDLRHPDTAVLDHVSESIRGLAERVAEQEHCSVQVVGTMDVRPVNFDQLIVEAVASAAENLALPFVRMTSGAMHDASSLAQIVPAAMIFVPCRGGISHSADEWADPQHLAQGCAVLADTAYSLANG